MSMTLKSIRISYVRGIEASITVPFVRKRGGAPGSVLLLGENGSGKTSIADAIEFGLRGKISRRTAGGIKVRRELKNLYHPAEKPSVVLEMVDGRVLSRGFSAKKQHNRLDPRVPIEGFELAPVVLRRRDVESFWSISEEMRQAFFFDFLRPAASESHLNEEERAEKIQRFKRATSDLSKAEEALKPLIQDWDGEMPRHAAGIQGLRRFAANRKRARDGRAEPRAVAIDSYEEALLAFHEAAAAGKQAISEAEVDRTDLANLLAECAPRVASGFELVTRSDDIRAVLFKVGSDSQLSIEIERANGVRIDPVEVLSEAHLDVLALLVLVEVHVACARRGQARFLILDDVFQSVDRGLRVRILDVIIDRLADWQLLITFHDRLWLEIARRAFVSSSVPVATLEVRSDTPHGESPRVSSVETGLLRDLQWTLDSGGSPSLITGAAGRALEGILEEATQHLNVQIRRKVDDRYTINDLWPPLLEAMKSCSNLLQWPALEKEVEAKRFLRNEIGAHYSVSADELTLTEARDFAIVVVQLYQVLCCGVCGRWRTRRGVSKTEWVLTPDNGCKHAI